LGKEPNFKHRSSEDFFHFWGFVTMDKYGARRGSRGMPTLLAGVIFAACVARAQTPAAAPPSPAAPSTSSAVPAQGVSPAKVQDDAMRPLAFDVVSIKPYAKDAHMIRVMMPPDGISIQGMPMLMILREAFGVTNGQLLGEPDWASAERFEVEAKVTPEDAPRLKQMSNDDRWAMLLPALEDRCKLKFHHETREMTVYSLVIAKGGPKMPPAQTQASAPPMPAPGGGPPAPPPLPAGFQPGEIFFMSRTGTTSSLARMLSRTLGNPVIDKTGLTGKYDCSLHFAPDENVRANMPPPPGGPPPESDGPSIFTALQEQLGLKLEAQKQQADVVVIEHMEQPTEN
jgi:uncharacterized protein (TIGR03435 family)